MKSSKFRQEFLNYFQKRGHSIIPSAPLIPRDDATTLFTGSGMQQLVPYLKGEPHPMGKRLVDSQPCFRAEDIEEVGDNRHTTFFEMLGNWSLGDYFKKEQLAWLFEFLTKVVGLDPKRLYVSVFEGSKFVPSDEESIKTWQEIFKNTRPVREGKKGFDPKTKIYSYDANQNWWSRAGVPEKMPVGEIGGPDSEVFYDFGPEPRLHEDSPFRGQRCHINCDCGRFLEIGNSVFIEYIKIDKGFEKLPQRNVDFGGGLERITAAGIDSFDIFKIDLFWNVIKAIEEKVFPGFKYSEKRIQPSFRILADHIRAITFLLSAGIIPSNKGQGYILRRLTRRAVTQKYKWGKGGKEISCLIDAVVSNYPEVKNSLGLKNLIDEEEEGFTKTLKTALKIWEKGKGKSFSPEQIFDFITTHGLPLDIIRDELGWGGDYKKVEKLLEEHKELSRTASEGMFKGGLAGSSKEITKLHTATHLLHEALRRVLGNHVKQVGSNITAERLRFDFTHSEKLTEGEIKKIESLVNEQIEKNLTVKKEIMSLEEAEKKGALAFFKEHYGEKVGVYTINDFSKEVCGGPHIASTGELGRFKIKKQGTVGAGKRRVYGALE